MFSPQNIPLDKVKELIPPKIFKEVKEKVWMDEIFNSLKGMRKEVLNIMRVNQMNGIQLSKVRIASIIVLNTI